MKLLAVLLMIFFSSTVNGLYAQDFLESDLLDGGIGDQFSPLETNAPDSVSNSLTDTVTLESYLKHVYLGKRVPVHKEGKKTVEGMVTNILFRDGLYYATIWNKRRSILETHINFVQLPGLPEKLVSLDASHRNRMLRQNIEVISFVNQAAIGNQGSAFTSTQRSIQGIPDLPRNKSVKRTRENDIIYFSVKEDHEKTGFFWIAKRKLFVDDGYRIRIRFEEVNE